MFPQEQNSFRQVCDKPCSHAICVAEWSPLRDLIAVVTTNGDVRLHRMKWKKVWVYSAKDKKAKCLSWMSCGKMLTIGYDDGSVIFLEIEKCKVIHTIKTEGSITCLKWNIYSPKQENKFSYKECVDVYLPSFKKEEILARMKNADLILNNEKLIVLSIGNSEGKISLYVNGVFHIVDICVDKFNDPDSAFEIFQLDANIGEGNIQTVYKNLTNNKYYYQTFHLELLAARNQELLFVSRKYYKCLLLISNLSKCFQQMKDTSEDVYIKITSRIKSLERLIERNNSSIAFEFMMAYTIGIASPELQTFFSEDLTSKALVQLAQSVDVSYNSLQSDIRSEFYLYLHHLIFHVTELQGIASWFEKFGILGLEKEKADKLKQNLIEINVKLKRLESLIVNDMKYFHVFFKWLEGFIHESNNESGSAKDQSFTDKEYDMMLEFLEFRLLKDEKDDCYNFEQVNQFFKKEYAHKFPSPENDFLKFIQENKIVKNSPLIFVPNDKISFPELVECFEHDLFSFFSNVSITLSESVESSSLVCLYTHVDNHAEYCHGSFEFMSTADSKYLSILPCCCDSANLFILRSDSEMNYSICGLSIDDPEILDESTNILTTLKNAKFYDDDTLTLLFEQEDENSKSIITYLAQLPISKSLKNNVIIEKNSEIENNGVLENENISVPMNHISNEISEIRKIESFSSKFVNVNGYSRQVSIIISMTGRRVRVFDMTADDDAEETIDENLLEVSQADTVLDEEDISLSAKE